MMETNKVTISGFIDNNGVVYNHSVMKEEFFIGTVNSRRMSGVVDKIPFIISEKLIDKNVSYVGKFVKIEGQFRSFNKYEGDSRRQLILQVFVNKIEILEGEEYENCDHMNHITLRGFLCKKPTLRKTPLKRDIADVLLAVNRVRNTKSDYIPCICWGRNASFAEKLEVGESVEISGRIQSREYIKNKDSENPEIRVAYEVSVNIFNQVDESDEDEQFQ